MKDAASADLSVGGPGLGIQLGHKGAAAAAQPGGKISQLLIKGRQQLPVGGPEPHGFQQGVPLL